MARNASAAKAAERGGRSPGPDDADDGGMDRNSRTSRDQGKRENAEDARSREDVLLSSRPMNLPVVPPRPGYVQRWVRTRLQGSEDADNVSRKESEGWRRRSIETIPKGVIAPKIKSGEHAGYIGVRGNILMERPEEIHQAYADRNRRATEAQMTAVEQQLHADHTPGRGLGRPKMSVKTEVGVRRNARRVEVQEDDEGDE